MSSEQNFDSFNNENVESDRISLREIISDYVYHWPIFLVSLIFALLAASTYLRYTKPIYEVNTTLLVKDDKKGSSANDLLSQLDITGGSNVVENEIEILKSKTLMAAVVKRLNLQVRLSIEGSIVTTEVYKNRPVNFQPIMINDEFVGRKFNLSFPSTDEYLLVDIDNKRKVKGRLNVFQRNFLGTYKIEKTPSFVKGQVYSVSFLDPTNVVNSHLSKITIALASKQSTVLRLAYQTTIPELGKDVLNVLIQVYNEASLADKNRTTQSTINFIDERLALITGELVEVEKDVEGFKSTQGLTDISSEASLYLDNVKVNDAKLNEVNLKLGAINGIKQYVNSESLQEKLPSTMGIDDPVLLSQISQLSELQLKKVNLLATTQPDNPIFESINQQIEVTRAGIKSTVNNIENSLKTTAGKLASNNNLYEGSIKKIPGQERKYISIKRQQSIKESLYLYLLQKKEESALSYASSVADSRTVDPAIASTSPIKPQRRIVYLSSLLIGLLLPLGYVYGKKLLNNKVSTSADLSKITSAPILGQISQSDGEEAIVVHEGSRKAIAEQFRAIRTNMQYLTGKRLPGVGVVTLITSSMSGEGKSFIASNIATAMSLSGKKTIILELDLRKPKISKYLRLKNSAGLSNYLIGSVLREDIIQPSNINANLFVIGSGPVPPNPSELLALNEMDVLFTYLRENYDEIIVDTPPIGLVTDAQILSRLADVSVYVARSGVTSKEQINQFHKLYLSKKFPRINVILNGVEMGGRYGYGYGYGYYSDDIDNSNNIRSVIKNIVKRF